ncbi:MAG: hypothetical protein IIY38_01635 [Clostridia bacterium]|nr:hypothetical protein [Clostridia bacterium]
MKKTLAKVIAALMSVLMITAVLSSSAMAANRNNVKQYPVYVCLGDSVASGFGLPDYNRRGKVLVYRTNIEGSYGNLLSKEVGATKAKGGRYYPCGYPGFTSAIFRYCLTDNFYPREWEMNQLQNFSYNDYSPEVLARERNHIRAAIAKADLVTVDLGVNDTWYSTIALIYEIAKYGTVIGVDPRKTLAEELAIYGSWGTVARNAMYYLAGFAEHPELWATFWGWWVDNLSSYFLQYQANFDAIMEGIFKLNPEVTVVILASGNPFRCLTLIPGARSGSLKLQWMGQPVQVDLPFVGTFTLPNFVHVSENPIANVTGFEYDFFYEPIRQAWTQKKPGQVFYADVTDYEMIMDHMCIPMYEFMTMDNSGFNPHATLAGNRYMADKILEVLPTR